jgi:uncharacterized protein (DUF58 family)
MRITTRGYGLLAAGALLLAAGFWFGYPELAALGAAAIVAVVGALAFVAWRPRLTVSRIVDPDRVMRGEPSRVTLHVANASRFFGASLVARDRLALADGRSASSRARADGRSASSRARADGRSASSRAGGTVPVPLVRLRPGKVTTVAYGVPTRRRGVIDIGPLEVSRRDPLALVGVVRRYGGQNKVWVRPRVHVITAVPVGLSRSMDGRIDRVPHGSITFAALREYVMGDDLRHVHWRTSARVGELMVREHVDTSLPRIVILLDDRAEAHLPDGGGGESTFEAACEGAASVLVAAYREDVQVELQLLSGATAESSRTTVGPQLDLLAEANLVLAATIGPDPLRAAMERLRVRRLGDTLLFLTGPPNEDDLGIVAGLRGAYPSIIAGTFGPVESGLATTAGVLVVGAADGPDFAAVWDGVSAW